MVDFIPYAKQSIDDLDIEEIKSAISSDFITRGPKVIEFESVFAEYCSVKYAVAFNSGTSALKAACFAADVNSFDRIITTPNTFIATLSAGLNYGADYTLADIDSQTGNIDLSQVREILQYPISRGRYIVFPVHFSGIPVDIAKLESFIKQPDALIIEDAAHALGSRYENGMKVGSCFLSDMTVFSFHPAKTITTGEGGMVTSNNHTFYRRLLRYRNNGIEKNSSPMNESSEPWYYEVHNATGNYNFTEFQAALGISQMKKLEKFIQTRKNLIKRYRKNLSEIPNISMSPENFDQKTAYHLCSVQIDFDACHTKRTDVINALKKKGIASQVHYIPLYKHPLLKKKNKNMEKYFPNAEAFYTKELSLPLYADLSEKQVDYICESLLHILDSS